LNFANVYNNGLFSLTKFVGENASNFEMPTCLGYLGWHDINKSIPISEIVKVSKEAENISIWPFHPRKVKLHSHIMIMLTFGPLNFANVYNNGFFRLTKFVAENVGNIQTWL
jgi:hypothetical protein